MRQIAAFLLIYGCSGSSPPTATPDVCEESDRTVISDLSVPADGMTFAPEDAVEVLDGAWIGTWSPIGGDQVDASLSFQSAGVEFVERTLLPGTGEGQGADVQCDSYYAIAASIQLSTADGDLDEDIVTEVQARDPTFSAFGTSIALFDVGGDARPTFDPDDWDHTDLSLYGTYAYPAFDGGATWQGYNDARDDGYDDDTVEPSGTTQGLGMFSLHR